MKIDTKRRRGIWYILPMVVIERNEYRGLSIHLAWLIWEVEINFD